LNTDCVLLLGRIEDTGLRSISLMDALRVQTRAGGIGVIHVPSAYTHVPSYTEQRQPLRAIWFKELIRQISHNKPIDVALFRSCRVSTVNVNTPLLFATPDLVNSSLVSRRVEQFARQVSHPRLLRMRIDLDPQDTRSHSQTIGEVGSRMRRLGKNVPWSHESGPASDFVRLKEKTETELGAVKALPPKTRWIQTELWEHGEGERRAMKWSLRPRTTYAVAVFIGASSEHSIRADVPFNDEALPPNKNEHQLVVIFSEPQISPEPQVATIVLPREGNSSSCEFYIHIPEETTHINARITILHRNRILQTALLGAGVLETGSTKVVESDERIKLTIESVIRPGMQDLSSRSWFDGALVMNHTAVGSPQITKAVGESVSRVQITGLAAKIKWFDDKISEVAEKWKKFEPLESKKSTDLLRACAMNGAQLYDGIILAQRADEALATAERIQVLSASYGARFPIEFLYGRAAPLPDAPLCKKAKEALLKGRCDKKCPTGVDEEKVICPLGFWGLNRVIERHAYDPADVKYLIGAEFGLQSEPATGRNRLNVLASAVVAASDNVDSVEAGSKQKVLDALDNATGKQSTSVNSWEAWIKGIDKRSPSLLVLLPHTLRDAATGQETLEISKNERLFSANLQRKHVLGKKGVPQPVVILMGCKTAAPDIPYESFVLQFRLRGAALVIGTGSTILGRHAATVTRNFINDIASKHSSNVSFGELMLNARRKLVADGLLMALCLTSYGDTDWSL
jgi:hypothetical protein